jgi:hypothetical protein
VGFSIDLLTFGDVVLFNEKSMHQFMLPPKLRVFASRWKTEAAGCR